MKCTPVIIIDDDAGSINKLRDDLSKYPDIVVLETFQSPLKARNVILLMQPDILFLDTEMPEMTGIDFFRSIHTELRQNTKVVFYTAYDKYLLEALRASAFDYLLKPYLPEELAEVKKKILSYLQKI